MLYYIVIHSFIKGFNSQCYATFGIIEVIAKLEQIIIFHYCFIKLQSKNVTMLSIQVYSKTKIFFGDAGSYSCRTMST